MDEDRTTLLEELSRLLRSGRFTDLEIRERLALTEEQFRDLRWEFETHAARSIVGERRETYESYLGLKLNVIRDIDQLVRESREAKDPRSALMALKFKGEQYDAMVKTAQGLGLVHKAHSAIASQDPKEDLSAMSDDDLAQELLTARGQIETFIGDFGEQDFLDLPEPDVFSTKDGEETSELEAEDGQVTRQKV